MFLLFLFAVFRLVFVFIFANGTIVKLVNILCILLSYFILFLFCFLCCTLLLRSVSKQKTTVFVPERFSNVAPCLFFVFQPKVLLCFDWIFVLPMFDSNLFFCFCFVFASFRFLRYVHPQFIF